jgi:acyl transferase domain-containing protein/acyl carrier protein
VEKVGRHDNFFDLGGHSLLITQVHSRIREALRQELSILDMFKYPTVSSLASYLSDGQGQSPSPSSDAGAKEVAEPKPGKEPIAIIGMAGRFPGARNVEELWQNLRQGVESISFFGDEEMVSAGVDPALLADPQYVKASSVLDDIELFDASFFGFSPREAETTDPQHRLFLECAQEAIDAAGYDPQTYAGLIGVYAGSSMSSYWENNLRSNAAVMEAVDSYQALLGNDKDFVPTRVSYKLNLKGPSINVQTACSTSLVAVHLACQSLLNGDCDLVLAGGVTVKVPAKAGYRYQEEGILSPDGHCRVFDAKAQGTVPGMGVGIVVLKRLSAALADGDTIHALIKGTAINNDGSLKVGYTAPSVEGQSKVIAAAQEAAGVGAETITYVEAHGTGTILGDPIEVAALTQAFRASTGAEGYCALGSIKSNLGHLDAAAGVTGLIKAVLQLEHQEIVPSLHFEQANPEIDFARSPFYVNTRLRRWERNGAPRRAGVSSFGIGGTNAHVVLEEPPQPKPTTPSRSWHLLTLSAKTESALEKSTSQLAAYLEHHSDVDLADVAYTLHVGRTAYTYRRALVCRDIEDAFQALAKPQLTSSSSKKAEEKAVAFMFPGQGTQYVNMGKELYESESVFREHIDKCAEFLQHEMGIDMCNVLYPIVNDSEEAAKCLKQTNLTQPALFMVEYALAKLWMQWGILPDAMIGHSIGEYVAACLAGVFSLEDGLRLVAARGRMMQSLPEGAMLAVCLSEQELQAHIKDPLCLAAVNGPSLCVVAGGDEAIAGMEQKFMQQDVICSRLHTSRAFHSSMMDPILQAFRELLETVKFSAPKIRYVSNLTGTWIKATEATAPEYWVRHLRSTVRFHEGFAKLLQEPKRVLLEVGPGQTLSALAHSPAGIFSSLRHAKDPGSDLEYLLSNLGKLWAAGAEVDWEGFHVHEHRRRRALPSYPFERNRHWVEPQNQEARNNQHQTIGKNTNIKDWFYIPSWKRTIPSKCSVLSSFQDGQSCCLVFDSSAHREITARLKQQRGHVVTVIPGERWGLAGSDAYTINPSSRADYEALIKAIVAKGTPPDVIVHLWNVEKDMPQSSSSQLFSEAQARGYYSLLFLAQALSKYATDSRLRLVVASSGLYQVTGEDVIQPEKSTLLGPCRVIPQEHPNIICQNIDFSPSSSDKQVTELLLAEIDYENVDREIAYRGRYRWTATFERVDLENSGSSERGLREKGVYLITGGLGRIGLAIARHLAITVNAKLALLTHSPFPQRTDWEQWLGTTRNGKRTRNKIEQIKELEKTGTEVLIVRANVADHDEMRAALNCVYERFGDLHGVFHTAGVTQGASIEGTLEDIGRLESELQFQPKVYGLYVLERLLRDKKLDFSVLFSSNASVLGGLGFIAYSAANHFVDAFARHISRESRIPWISTNWDGWRFAEESSVSLGRSNVADFSILPSEGLEALSHVLEQAAVDQVVISRVDLLARLTAGDRQQQAVDQQVGEAAASAVRQDSETTNSRLLPRNDIEATIAELWGKLLGIAQPDISEDFFNLGGNSLLGTRLMSKIRTAFRVEMPLRCLFECPTIAMLAERIGQLQRMQEETDKIEVLRVLDGLSDEDIEKELSKAQVGSITRAQRVG